MGGKHMDSKLRTMAVELTECVSTPSDVFSVPVTKQHYISRGTIVRCGSDQVTVIDQYNRFVLLQKSDGTQIRVVKDTLFCNPEDIVSNRIKDRSIKGPPKTKIEKILKPKVLKKKKKKTFIPQDAHDWFIERLADHQSGKRTIRSLQYEPKAHEKHDFRVIDGSKTSSWILLTSSKWDFGIYYLYNLETTEHVVFDPAVHKNGFEVVWPQ